MDDTIRPGVTLESLTKLKPVFDWGKRLTTAGNASGVGDGAAICIMTTRENAVNEGWDIIGNNYLLYVCQYLWRLVELGYVVMN